ncbi:MAG TPA: CPBP family intramembrane metalloprotease [Thermoplasmatales archaeon]|nr:CPBP family intramembrane metalloprotease [Thermoplasmatales archaeon]
MTSHRTAALLILSIPFLYIYGLSLLTLPLAGEASYVTPGTLFFSLLLNLLVMGGASFLYVLARYGGPWRRVLHRLFFRREGWRESLALGAGVGIALLLLSGLVVLLFQALGFSLDNPLAESIMDNLTPFLLVAVPLLAALSEETFFRGLLQMEMARWRGQPVAIAVTSLLFGLAHLSYGQPLQVLIPFLLGLALGLLMMKTRNLLAPIAAHFTFNFAQLAVAYYA